jgi:D-glucosaminate-specific PTS system IIC component
MFVVALVAGLYCWVWGTNLGYTLMGVMQTPICVALVLGLALGDVPTAMIMGGTIQAMYMGIVATGGNMPSDGMLAACIAIPVAIKTGMSVGAAVTLAVPVGLLGALLIQLKYIIQGYFARMADRYAEDANTTGIVRCAWLYPFILNFFLRFVPVFIAVYFGAEIIQPVVNSIPAWLSNGLSVAGGLLPALGFGLILLMIGQPKYLPYFIIGYFAVQFLGISTMAAAIFAICIAVLTFFASSNSEKTELLS